MIRFIFAVFGLTLMMPHVLAPGPAHAQTPSWVEIPAAGETLRGALYLPSGSGPHPAVLALHGCGGLSVRSARVRDWAVRLTDAGFAVLFADSFGSRGLKSQCGVRKRTIRATRERIGDAHAALAYLLARGDIKANAVSLLGWSNGGATVISSIAPRHKPGLAADFARAVAFYPGCRFELRRGGWSSRVPLLILAGGADDWTPAAPCAELAKGQANVSITIYPGAYHNFDDPDRPVRQRTGTAYSADGSGIVHQGTDPKARKDAIVRTLEYLAR